MTNKAKKIRFAYSCVTALLILIMGIGLIFSCVSIYHSGDRPFSREAIVDAARYLAIPGWLCILAVIGGIILRYVLPEETEKTKPIHADATLLTRYESKFESLEIESKEKIHKEIKLMMLTKLISTLLMLGLCIYPIVYFADGSHFGVTDINGDIAKAVLVVLIPTLLCFVIIYISGRIIHGSVVRQITIYKSDAIKPEKFQYAPENPKSLNVLRYAFIAIAIALIVMGIANDGVADVLGKAIRICTECIGLG